MLPGTTMACPGWKNSGSYCTVLLVRLSARSAKQDPDLKVSYPLSWRFLTAAPKKVMKAASVEYSAALSLVAESACAEMVDGRRPLNSLVAEMSVRFFGMVVQCFENSVASLETLRERIILLLNHDTEKWLAQRRRRMCRLCTSAAHKQSENFLGQTK